MTTRRAMTSSSSSTTTSLMENSKRTKLQPLGIGKKNLSSFKSSQTALQAVNAASLVASSVGMAGPMGINSTRSNTTIGRTNITNSNLGAGAPNFSGTWQLDRENSDSTNDYLEAMGLPLIARQAADKLDLTVVIQQDDNDFIITRKTRIFTETKHLKFGQEIIVKSNAITVTGTSDYVETISQLVGMGVLKDTRTLTEDKNKMWVVLELTLPDKSPVIIKRVFQKLSDSISTEIDDETLLQYESALGGGHGGGLGSISGSITPETSKRKR